ncbi:alpha/beta hydrolase [Fulvivirgaceae bacterium PWU4]|uniref:Alpha/beta hydrolase n=1 Tax=Chryseosolibacter histidini TaxID=2782349 RepID=A0AAP2GPJ8_9BACT|nr:alpha/beta hydrolase [Chryseosolibacter histidini]MBT1698035.1 alpha/beta hydrolase [Chryseosolibacter histidini]
MSLNIVGSTVAYLQNFGASDIDIAFQRLGKSTDVPVFLIMGAGAQMISWPEGLCNELMSKGLHLIRFDNRDSGLSTHFSHCPLPDFNAAMAGDFSTVPYSLSEMAADTVALMDALCYERVHIVGASMGGMIAQTIAIEHRSRVKSLTSIMSSTGAQDVGQTDYSLLAKLGMPPMHDRQEYIKWRIRSLKATGSPIYPLNERHAEEIAGIAWDRDHDPTAIVRQAVAVLKSGDRTSRLRSLKIPSLVIHGDSDVMVNVSGGIATAAAIPNAKLQIIEGMGHSFPEQLFTRLASLIVDHIFLAELQVKDYY